MKLQYTEQSKVDRVEVIKAIRVLTGYGLKDAKDLMDDAIDGGSADRDIKVFPNTDTIDKLTRNGFTVLNDKAVLINKLQSALDTATEQREYTIIRLLCDAIDAADGNYHPSHYCPPAMA